MFAPLNLTDGGEGRQVMPSKSYNRHSGAGRNPSKHRFQIPRLFQSTYWIPVCTGMTRGLRQTPSFWRRLESMNLRDFESHFRIDGLNLEAYPKSMTSVEAPQILVDQTCWQSVWNETGRATAGSFTQSGPPGYIAALPAPAGSPGESRSPFPQTPTPRKNRDTGLANDVVPKKHQAKTRTPGWSAWHMHI